MCGICNKVKYFYFIVPVEFISGSGCTGSETQHSLINLVYTRSLVYSLARVITEFYILIRVQ